MRILIVDDHAIVRKGLAQIIRESEDMVVAGEAGTAVEALELMDKDPFDVVVLDISLPGRSGIDLLKDIRKRHPMLPVLVLSVHSDALYAARSFREGASGYLTKEAAPERLIEALTRIGGGGKYVTTGAAEYLVRDLSGAPTDDGLLSNRELQVLCLIASGKSVSQTAEQMSLSVKTISTYRGRILVKLGLHGNSDITRYAFEHRLVT